MKFLKTKMEIFCVQLTGGSPKPVEGRGKGLSAASLNSASSF